MGFYYILFTNKTDLNNDDKEDVDDVFFLSFYCCFNEAQAYDFC